MKKLWMVGMLLLSMLSCKTQKDLTNKINGNYTAHWEKIEDYIKKGFPEKAITSLEELVQLAKVNNDPAVATQAILKRINLKNLDQQDFMKDQISYLDKQLDSLQDPISRSFIYYSLALIYQNYWETNQNLVIDQKEGDDEWDGNTYMKRITDLLDSALMEELKMVPIKEVDNFFNTAYDPSLMLWDFFKFEQIRILKSKLYTSLLGEDESRALIRSNYTDLISKLKLGDQDKLWVEVEMEQASFFDEDIANLISEIPQRYSYILDYYLGLTAMREAQQIRGIKEKRATKSKLYQESLKKFALVQENGDSIYQNNATVQIESIKSSELQVAIEQVLIPAEPSLAYISFRNIEKVYLKIYQLEKEDYLENRREKGFPYKNKPIVYESEIQLPSTEFPYTSLSTEIKLPAFKAGFYGIVVNTNENFAIESLNPLFQSNFLVSNLSINHYYDESSAQMKVECIDRTSGVLISGAHFKIFDRQYNSRNQAQNLIPVFEGIGNPTFTYTPNFDRDYYPFVEMNGQFFFFQNGLYQNSSFNRANITSNILTDRAIYRPGQIVHFQGILYQTNENRMPQILPGVNFEISVTDNMGNKINELQLTSDEYGAYSGKFDIPDNTQNGSVNFNLSSKSIRLNAYKSIQVEQYKRPKYTIAFQDMKEVLKLDAAVKVAGEVMGFTGVPVTSAKVSYKVYRSVWWPYFYRGYRSYFPPGGGERTLIASGNKSTSQKGIFDFEFKAERSVANADFKNFSFTVEVEVVDNTGETKTESKTYNISDQSVFIKFEQTDTEGKFRLSTVNAENQSIEAQVEMTIFAKAEKDFHISRYWEFPDTTIVSQGDFPNYSFISEEEMYSDMVYSEMLSLSDTIELDLKDLVGAGNFLVKLDSGEDSKIEQKIEILDFDEGHFGNEQLFYIENIVKEFQPGNLLSFRVGSKIKDLRVQILKYRDDKLISEEWKSVNGSFLVEKAIEQEDIGGFSYVFRSYYHNRVDNQAIDVNVPWKMKDLFIKAKSIRYVTEPGAPEKWTFVVTDNEGNPVKSRFLSSMYDAALDEFQPHNWQWSIYPSYTGTPYFRSYSYGTQSLYSSNYGWNRVKTNFIPFEIIPNFEYAPMQYNYYQYYGRTMRSGQTPMGVQMDGVQAESMAMEMDAENNKSGSPNANSAPPPPPPQPPGPPLNVRTNLSEMVFFLPDLATNDQGEVSIEFENNEALTRWKLQNFAYTKDLKYGFSSEEIVTRKELMIQANQPRFLRSGDQISLSAKLINLSDDNQTVDAKLTIVDQITLKNIDLKAEKRGISIESDGQKEVFWDLKIPDGVQMVKLVYSVSGANHEDAEQHIVQIVPNKVYLIDSETFLLDGKMKRSLDVNKMLTASKETSALTLESTGSPAWYAVRALPYLMENESENSEAIFNRYFANALALKIMDENPLVEKYYREWQDKGNLNSQLSLNETLKNIDLRETPWLRDALSEEANMLQMAVFFDREHVMDELKDAMTKLERMQMPGGGFPWFNEGRPNFYISQYILQGILRLQELGIGDFPSSLKSSLNTFCASEALKLEFDTKEQVPGILIKNVWISEVVGSKMSDQYEKLVSQVKKQLQEKWYEYGLEEQIFIAKIFISENRKLSEEIVASLFEKSFYKEQLGRFWNQNNAMIYSSWDIDVQAAMISLFDEIGGFEQEIDEMKFWLISNKRTNNWRSNIATSSAIYALSLGSSSSFVEGKPIETFVNDEWLTSDAMVGVNYEKYEYNDPKKIKEINVVTFQNPNSNKAWANVHHQFFQKYEDVQRTNNDFLDIKKEIYKVGMKDQLVNVEDQELALGDRIRVRLIIEIDRPMQFIHVSDDRPAGAEPFDLNSGYVWSNRLSYYRSIKDLGTQFFIDYLQKGRHVIEYDMFINNLGSFNAGVAKIQNMYAPEFNDYSKSVRIKVTN